MAYPTGISAQPIDVTSGARAFMKSAVEARLDEIRSSQERISENQQTVLKALSIEALPELAQEQRQRYSQEIDDYRQRVVDMYKNNKGELGTKELMDIQDGFQKLQNNMVADVNNLKMFQQYQEKIYDPNFGNFYDIDKAQQILANKYSDLMQGKGIGNIAADFAQAQLPPSVGDYMSKFYGEDLAALNKYELGDIKGNIFTETEYQGLALENNPNLTPLQKEGIAKAQRIRADIMSNPNLSRMYRTPDGSVDEAKLSQAVTDRMSTVISKSSTFKPSTSGSSSSKNVYLSTEPDTEKIKADDGYIDATYQASVPTTGVTSFSYDGDRVAVEAIQWMPVAKDATKYKKLATYGEEYNEREPQQPAHKFMIIDDKNLDKYDPSEIEYKPFAKLVVPTEKGLFFQTIDDLAGKSTVVKYAPFEGKVKAAIADKMATKRDAYFEKIEEAQGMIGSAKQKKEVKEVERVDKKTGKIYIFDADTKEFIREK